MARNPEEEYQAALATLESHVEAGDVTETDAEHIRRLCAAFDPEDATESKPSDLYDDRTTEHKSKRTLGAWVERLAEAAQHVELTGTDADTINAYTTGMVKADSPSTAHVRNIEWALSKFYRYHDGLGIDPRGIEVHPNDNGDGTEWDERDLLDADERAALRTVATHPRDRCVLHLLLYCGLRNTALRTLRVKDILLNDHVWHFNGSADGLKDIHRPRESRPLFQAERAVRDWLDRHPDPSDDHYLITAKPEWSRTDPTEPVTRETIRKIMSDLKDKTAERDDVVTVEKPCHPHMMRHNAVSQWRKHPDLTDGEIKFWLGHKPESNVMETTYSHLSADDWNAAGHNALGVADAGSNGDDETIPWDSTCDSCNAVIAPGEDECAACGADRGTSPWDTPEELDGDLGNMIREAVREELGPWGEVMESLGDADPESIEKAVNEVSKEIEP